jgi:hypothetical protein
MLIDNSLIIAGIVGALSVVVLALAAGTTVYFLKNRKTNSLPKGLGKQVVDMDVDPSRCDDFIEGYGVVYKGQLITESEKPLVFKTPLQAINLVKKQKMKKNLANIVYQRWNMKTREVMVGEVYGSN